jgi:hypothetical protein
MDRPRNVDPLLILGDGGDGGDGCGDGGVGSNLKKGCEKRVYSIRNMSHSVNVYLMR